MSMTKDTKQAAEAVNAELKRRFMVALKRYMLARGLDQASLATRMHVSDATVSKWMSGSIPRKKRFTRLATVLGVEPLDLTQIISPDHKPKAA